MDETKQTPIEENQIEAAAQTAPEAVESVAAGSEIRAGKTHKRKPRAVRASAYRFNHRFDSCLADSGKRRFDYVETGRDFFLHIAVLFGYGQLNGVFSVFFIKRFCNVTQKRKT